MHKKPTMTRRTRNHILEDQSLAALPTFLPASWVIHQVKRDYGIDVQIELFSADGEPTGLRCYGQVKATDNDFEKDKLALDREHFEYWSAQTDPVALFRYFAKTKKLYWCWLHEVGWQMKPCKDYFDVSRFLKEWDINSSPSETEQYLVERRKVLASPLEPPFIIAIEQKSERNTHASIIAARITNNIRSSSFRISPNSIESGQFLIQLSQDSLVCSYRGMSGVTFHHKKGFPDDKLDGIALLALFFCSCKNNCVLVARELAKSITPLLYKSAASADLEWPLIDLLIFALGLKTAIKLLEPLVCQEENKQLAWGTLFLASAFAAQKYGESRPWTDLLYGWAINPPEQIHIGSIYYNLGNAHSQDGRWEEAYNAYKMTLELDPSYRDKHYFWSEWGAASFEMGNFHKAAEYYEESLKLKDSIEISWRLGEVFFNLGKFKEARDCLNEASKDSSLPQQTYVQLLLLLCNELIEIWDIESQKPKELNEGEYENFKNLPSAKNEQKVKKFLKPLIKKNATDALLGYNAGGWSSRSGCYLIATYRFLTCAIKQRHDAQAWVNAFACACNAKEITLAICIAHNAYFFLGADFLPWFQGKMPGAPQFSKEMVTIIEKATQEFERLRPSAKHPIIRLHTHKGTLIYE